MRHAVLALCALPLLIPSSVGCTHSRPLLVRNAFASSYWCPVNQIEVRPEPGSDRYLHASGCGHDAIYDCGNAAEASACQARLHVDFEATDGTMHGAWLDEEPAANDTRSREAALASAAHDLPCAAASLQIVRNDAHGYPNVVEGCGQRVTYVIVDDADQPQKHKYVVAGRSSLAAPPPAAPPPSAAPPASAAPSAAPPSPAPAVSPAPAPSASAAPSAPTAPPAASGAPR